VVSNENCAKYVAILRGLYLLHQNHHWISEGSNFYGNHLLFQRIYEAAQADADLAAEKFIGLFGIDSLKAKEQGILIAKFLNKYSQSENLVKSSLDAEKEFLQFSKELYDTYKSNESMTLGLDDMLMAIASKREESVYLLQQVLGGKTSKAGRNKRLKFLKSIKNS